MKKDRVTRDSCEATEGSRAEATVAAYWPLPEPLRILSGESLAQRSLCTLACLVPGMGFGKDGKGVIIKENNGIALGTLAQQTAILLPAIAVTEDFRMLKAEIHAMLNAATTGEASLLVMGLADAELSLAEVEEAFELNGPLDRNDNVNRERAERPVWILGGLGDFGETDIRAFYEWKKRWTFSSPEGWNLFVYNQSSSASLTTGSTIRVLATYYGVWVT